MNATSVHRPLGLILAAVASVIAIGCGSSLQYTHEQANDGRFESYRTVAFVTDHPVDEFELVELDDTQMDAAREATREALGEKGYTLADAETADLIMVPGFGRRSRMEEKMQVELGDRFTRFSVEIAEGAVVVDAYDRRNGELVWHGQVTGSSEVQPDQRATPERVREAVTLLWTEFPAAGTGPELPEPEATAGGEVEAPEDGAADDGAIGEGDAPEDDAEEEPELEAE